ncbi:MAG: divalent metal cation transporter, partial [Thermomicrobiales bacterium]
FYAVIITSTLIGMLIDFSDLDTITALYWTAVLNGLLAPPLLVLVMLIANNRSVMGERTNGRALNLLGWGAVVAMSAAALGLLWTWR